MAFNIETVAARLSVWSGEGVKIASAASRLYTAYLKLSPTTKAAMQADLQTLESQWTAIDEAFDAYDKTNKLSKIAAAMTIFDAVAKGAPIIGRIAKDGETVFGADWAVIKPDVGLILTTLKGTAA